MEHIFKLLTKVLPLIIILFACKNKTAQTERERIAPLLDGMGELHYPVSTDDTLAQRYFDQGLVLSYGFNHKEAFRSFKQATLLDSTLAMAYWGKALVLGPNINSAMDSEDNPAAWKNVQLALKYADDATQKEQDLIHALEKRYAEEAPEDRSKLDKAYAEAMGKVAEKYRDDIDIQALYAESLMDLHPWNYWEKNGDPQPWTPNILETLEYAMEQDPDHPGANHFYIHAVEASDNPERALPSAKVLEGEVPGAGHLVHMPSHVYIRTGDYHKGTMANERAVQSDNSYVTQCRQQGIYPLAYVPHNYHFLWATATMEGRKQRSIEAAMNTSAQVDTATMRAPGLGTLQHYWIIPLYAYVRFGEWDRILDYDKPADDLIYPLGIWHYARGMAYTGKGQLDSARVELEKVEKMAANDALKDVTIWQINTTQELVQIAAHVLQGELAAKQRNYDKAIRNLRDAMVIEDQLNYNEPPDWFFPVRHSLGAVLLKADKPKEAEKVYRIDLKKFPENGWSLYGLHKSLKQQGKEEEAKSVKSRFEQAWQYADIKLEGSRIM